MKSTILENERRKLESITRFQLSYKFKKIGLVVFITSFVVLLALKIPEAEPSMILKSFLKSLLILGLLAISLSKEKVEDEYIEKLRSQSYRLAFVIGVVYALVQPFVNYGVDSVLAQENPNLDMSYFQVLTFMLLIQIFYFKLLKRMF